MFADDENAGNALKLLPSVGRGVKLPPLCDVPLPKAYYDDLPPHLHMLSKSGLGRGQQLQELVGDNRDLERPGDRSLPSNIVCELPVCSVTEDDFPELKSAKTEHLTLPEKPVSQPEVPQKSLKTLAAQFTKVK